MIPSKEEIIQITCDHVLYPQACACYYSAINVGVSLPNTLALNPIAPRESTALPRVTEKTAQEQGMSISHAATRHGQQEQDKRHRMSG
jgi:hypothetical protein